MKNGREQNMYGYMKTDEFIECLIHDCVTMQCDVEVHEFLYNDVPTKIYMDIEKIIDPSEEVMYDNIAADIVETAIRVTNEYLGVKLSFNSHRSFVSTSATRMLADGTMKFSRHVVICPRYSVQSMTIVKNIVDKTVNVLRLRNDYNLFDSLIDTGVYKTRQCFRVPYSAKLGNIDSTH
jgi:hypothetical protein